MKPHVIIKDFAGSQTGHDYHEFHAGQVKPLSDSLAKIVVKEGWAKPYVEAEIKPRALSPSEMLVEGDLPADASANPEDSGDAIADGDSEEKSEGDAPSNKARKAAPSNKSKK